MKKEFLILAVVLSVLLSGCSGNNVSDESTDIPDTLIVDADLPEDVPSEVSIYEVSYKNFDSDKLLEYFNMKPVSFSERIASGQMYDSGNSRLFVYDDEGDIHGGFRYIKDMVIFPGAVVTDYYNTTLKGDKISGGFSDMEALDFFETIGLEQLKVDQAYEISGEQLREFVNSSSDYEDNVADAFNPEDKYTLVYFLQYIDDIPLIDTPWDFSGRNPTYTSAEAIIFENQMIENYFVNLYDIEQEISTEKIISPETALNTFVESYNKEIQFDKTIITSIALKYIITVDKREMYAQPAYVFEYEYQKESENLSKSPTREEIKVVSAITGKFIL